MRCPDCNKFTGLENGDVEINSLEANFNGEDGFNLTADVRGVRNCADCGTELKSLDMQMEGSVLLNQFEGWKELSPEEQSKVVAGIKDAGLECEAEEGDGSVDESGGGR